jgi:hypothetical protein
VRCGVRAFGLRVRGKESRLLRALGAFHVAEEERANLAGREEGKKEKRTDGDPVNGARAASKRVSGRAKDARTGLYIYRTCAGPGVCAALGQMPDWVRRHGRMVDRETAGAQALWESGVFWPFLAASRTRCCYYCRGRRRRRASARKSRNKTQDTVHSRPAVRTDTRLQAPCRRSLAASRLPGPFLRLLLGHCDCLRRRSKAMPR